MIFFVTLSSDLGNKQAKIPISNHGLVDAINTKICAN